ncbi:MAG: class I SAM-dependent methyltransferase [Candidatus Bathyarchaeota archaeon]|nr:class I SAM-dependent methyltransferase [Candidatus Bathyarchaeum sp.]
MKGDNPVEVNNWRSAEHVRSYLSIADDRPHGEEIVKVLLEQVPSDVSYVLDLGTGDGRLLALVLQKNPKACGVGLDFSEPMLERARKRFEDTDCIEILKHDLNESLPKGRWEPFDLVISGLAIHHLVHGRKKELYTEVFGLLRSGGVFLNLEHVASPTKALHQKFLAAIGLTPQDDDPSNKLLDVHTQLEWLRQIGYKDVDCHFKWLEIALLGAVKP